jgi:hypothetical protein
MWLSLLGFATGAYAQFSSNVTGVVADTSGGVVPGVTIVLTDRNTQVTTTTTSGTQGEYRFVSLAPGSYDITASARGFATHKVTVQLITDQVLNVPFTLGVSAQSQSVVVTDQAPVLDTADSRTQLTISSQEMDSLPLAGRNVLGLLTIAPGVTGLGLDSTPGNGQTNDNYASETQVSASANGRSSVGNMFVLDGLDITSDVTPGVLNLVPNPDTLQETTVQVNTFTVDYGRSSSIVQVMTSKSGSSKYHFMASEYYTANWLTARTEFQPKGAFPPFHSSNISTTASGPVPFLKQMYFFSGWEPLLASQQSTSQATYEDPGFTTWATQNWPNSIGVKLLAQYPSSNATTTSVAKRGSDLYPTTCGTAAAANVPCGLAVFDNGVFNATNSRNALQYNVRVDKYFSKDRVYANYYRTGLDLGGPSIRVNMGTPQHYLVRAIQGNETHTFNSSTINEAGFGFLRMEGLINKTGPFHVPIISVTGMNTSIGVSKAIEDYIQHHYVWRDVFTHVYRAHQIRAGYEGSYVDSLALFGPWNSQPTYSFQSVADFLHDNIYQETGLKYDLLTGRQSSTAAISGASRVVTGGVFVGDSWKVNKKLNLNYGVRWDNFGNAKSLDGFTRSNFFYGPGSTILDQVANGYLNQVPRALNHAITEWSPRVGVSYDPFGNGRWLIRGGIGLYHDWLTLGNSGFASSINPASVTFQSNTSGPAPIYSVGTSDTFPFGFTYPVLPSSGLNDHGGIVGLQSNISGGDPNLKGTNTYNYTVTLERGLGSNYSVAAGYSGAKSNNLYTDFAGHTLNTTYGVDINNFPGSLIQNNGKLVRLNQNFGTIRYTTNGPTANYNAFIGEFKGRLLKRGFIDASYTRSSSYDDAGTYPTVQSNTLNYHQYWARSLWDVPNRISMAVSYELPHLRDGPNFLKAITDGWKPSVITILQSGTPFTVLNTAAYKAGVIPGSPILSTSGGDYNADGTNSDLPNVPTIGYNIPTDRKSQLNGVFKSTDFTAPGTLPNEGNEVINGYRNPGFANTDFALLKNTRLWENANLQLRFEMYNMFNRASLVGLDSGLESSTFGKATSQYPARQLQLGARFEF